MALEIDNSITTISDEELDSINYAISSRYGLDFTGYEPSSLKRRIVRIIHKFELNNVIGLWQKLLYDKEFIFAFKDEVSVGLTEMFRNPEVWQMLRDVYLPSLYKLNKEEPLKVWHAGCSTGEEVHTMAIVLEDAGLLHKCTGLASDLSDKFVETSKNAAYDADLLKKYEQNLKIYNPLKSIHDYFDFKGDTGKLSLKYKRYSVYKQHNLTGESISNEKYDIIFCRNVMIYFNDHLKMSVLEMFKNHLKPNGIFIIGHFDAMPNAYEKYFTYADPGLKFFKKV